MAFVRGNDVRLSVDFTLERELVDPTTVTFVVRPPRGALQTYVYGVDALLVREAQGKYYVDVRADVSGVWHYRWVVTGDAQGAEEGSFEILPSEVV